MLMIWKQAHLGWGRQCMILNILNRNQTGFLYFSSEFGSIFWIWNLYCKHAKSWIYTKLLWHRITEQKGSQTIHSVQSLQNINYASSTKLQQARYKSLARFTENKYPPEADADEVEHNFFASEQVLVSLACIFFFLIQKKLQQKTQF